MKSKIVIIGAGLTGLTIGFRLKKSGHDFIILEKQNRTGGVIKTINEDGFILETGPNTGVLSAPELVELFDDLRDLCTLETADASANKRYILKNGRWTPLPSGLLSAVSTPLFTLKDKIRILGEPFRKPGTNPDESVAELVRRRMGKSFLDYAVNPFISGIYAGNPEKLVTRYALPKLYALEQNYGSFIKGSIAKAKLKKTELEKRATREVFSAKGGLQNLTDALTSAIGKERILTGCSGTVVNRSDKYIISTTDSQGNKIKIDADFVITTTGGYVLPELLPFVDVRDLQKITALEYARVVQVSAAYKQWDGMKLDAFGGLVPEKEKKKILGILFPSAIFNGRAPAGGAMLSVFLGGTRNPELIEKTDDDIMQIVMEGIRGTMHSTKYPDLVKVSRYEHAIPQYGRNSGERIESIGKIEKEYPGLILAGNIRDGIGMADRVKQGKNIADLFSDRV